jgi:hypothetical protein
MSASSILHKSRMIGSLAYDADDEAILKCYTEETRQQFAAVIRTIIESSLAQALATSQRQMDGWIKSALDGAIRNAKDALAAVTGISGSNCSVPGATMECLCRRPSLRLWPTFPWILAGKTPVILPFVTECEEAPLRLRIAVSSNVLVRGLLLCSTRGLLCPTPFHCTRPICQ